MNIILTCTHYPPVLTNSDLKQIVGGYDVTGPAEFICECEDRRGNPPYAPVWKAVYDSNTVLKKIWIASKPRV